MDKRMYAAYARNNKFDQFEMVTLKGEIFFANKGFIELCIQKSKEKHPDWEY